MVMQVRRTLTVGATPTALSEGQLSVGMADQPPIAWVGVPTSVNPAGVIPITGLVRTVAGAPQPAGALGQLWWDEDAAQLFVYTGNEWVVAVNPPIPDVSVFAKSTTATSPPSSPAPGDFWYNPTTGFLLIWNGSDWVSTVHKIPGVTDGSSAAPGEVGEVFLQQGSSVSLAVGNVTTLTSYTVPAGDWDIAVGVSWSLAGGSGTTLLAGYYNTGAGDILFDQIGFAIATRITNVSLAYPRLTYSSTTATSLTVRGMGQTGDATMLALGYIRGRRMR